MKSIAPLCLLFLCSCGLTINQVHTQGEASDVVDEQQDISPDVSPTLSLPMNMV